MKRIGEKLAGEEMTVATAILVGFCKDSGCAVLLWMKHKIN